MNRFNWSRPLWHGASLMFFCAPAMADSTELAPLVVEARHWQDVLNEVPATVLVDQPEATDTELWHDLEAIAGRAANTHIEQSSVQTRLVVRGTTAANTGLQDPLGYFIDGVALPMGANQAPVLFNQQQVELIKGPQGALYGRNTEAGALKVITRAPADQPEVWVNLSHILVGGENDDQTRNVIAAGLSGPVTDNSLSAGLALRVEQGDTGYLNLPERSRDGGEVERYTLSASADWLLSDNTDLSLRSTLEKNDSGMARMRYQSGAFATPRQTTNYNIDAEQERRSGVHGLTVNHRLASGAELTAITGYTHYDRDFVMDLDAAQLPSPPSVLALENRMLSQEFRLSSAEGEPGMRWLLGSYLFTEESDIDFTIGAPSTLRQTTIDQDGIALFGQLELPLSPRLTLAAGARLEYLKQQGAQQMSSMFSRGQYSGESNHTELLPRVDLSYRTDGDLTLYVSLARGYLPGGYNYNLAGDLDSFTYDAEYSDTAEVGVKGALLNGRLNTSLALFYTRATDKQIVDLLPGGLQSISNAGEARIYGLELALDARLGGGWRSFAELGWQHAEATQYKGQTLIAGAPATVEFSGNDLPMAAPFSYSLGLAYAQQQGMFGQLRLNGSDGVFFDSANSLQQSAYSTVDLELGYQWRDLKVSLAARNLLDEHYVTRAVNTPNGQLVEDAAPREISLNLSTRW